MQTDITKTILDAQARQEAEAFQSFMQGESAKRTIAWEQEKIELRNQHEFDMGEQRKEIENQLAIESDGRQRSKLEAKIQALRDANERGQITEKKMNAEILRMELGIPASQSPLFGKKDEASIFADLLQERDAGPDVSPEQKNSAALLALGNTLNESDQKDVNAIVKEGDFVKIRQTLDILEARKEVEKGPSLLKSLSPLGNVSELMRLNKLKRRAGVPEETKRPQSPAFASFRQSAGSFR